MNVQLLQQNEILSEHQVSHLKANNLLLKLLTGKLWRNNVEEYVVFLVACKNCSDLTFFCIKIVPIRAGAVLRNDKIAWRDKRPSLISLHKLYKEQLPSLSVQSRMGQLSPNSVTLVYWDTSEIIRKQSIPVGCILPASVATTRWVVHSGGYTFWVWPTQQTQASENITSHNFVGGR